MKVITFDNKNIADSAMKLTDAMVSAGITPDVVIGIRTGGGYIADAVMKVLSGKHCRPLYIEAFLQRSSTPRKKRLLSGILPFFPTWILDRLRIIESYMLARNVKNDAVLPEVMFSGEISGGKILVVDDAIDSGRTMKAVLDSLVERGVSRDDIFTAVITVTTDSPLIKPDYYIYNKTLIRFPWSIDYRKS